MQNGNRQAAIRKTSGKSVQPHAAESIREQPRTTPDSASTGSTLGSLGGQETPPPSQSSAAAGTQIAILTPTDGTFANAKVPVSRIIAVDLPIVPLSATEAFNLFSTKPGVAEMTLDEKFTCLKQGFAYGYGIRRVLVELFESIRNEFKTYAKGRAGMPTVQEAFTLRGLNYQTIYSAIQREKKRRTEDAQFFDAIKAEQATNNIHGIQVTDDDLPPIGEKVVVKGGRQAVVLTHRVAEGGGKTAEVAYEDDGTTEIKNAGSLVILAEIIAAKAAAKAAAKGGGKKKNEAAETKRIAVAAAKEDDAPKSDAFYATQYFALVALINDVPKNVTSAEFAQTLNDNLRVAYESLNADEAKLIKPFPPAFPSFNGTKGINNLVAYLSADAIGRPSPLKTIFGALNKDKFRDKVGTFARRICEQFYEGEFVVTVGNRKHSDTKASAVIPKPDHSPTAKGNNTTDPTLHGFYAKLTKDNEYGTPWHVFQIGASEKPQAFAKTRQDAELKVMQLERKFADNAKATQAVATS